MNRKIMILLGVGMFLVLIGFMGCSNPSSGSPSVPLLDKFNNDTMTQEFADEWLSVDGETLLVLKDNTFAVFSVIDSSDTTRSVSSSTRVGNLGGPGKLAVPKNMGRLECGRPNAKLVKVETEVVCITEEQLEVVSSGMDISGISSTMPTLPGMDFTPPTGITDFEVGEWVSQEQFTTKYESSYTEYYEYYFEYVEEFYIEYTGMSISSLIPGWSDLISDALGSLDMDPSMFDSFFPTNEVSWEITETSEERTMRTVGFAPYYLGGTGTQMDFISDLPQGCMVAL